jgi:outer membrane cobalamin receptor
MVKASFMLNYLTTTKLLKSVSFNVFYRFNTRRYINFENTSFVPRFDVLDANLSFGINVFKSIISLKFIVNNILSENYQPVPGYPMPPRNYRLELGFKY